MVSFGAGLSVRIGASASRIVSRNHPLSATPPHKCGHPRPRAAPRGDKEEAHSPVEDQSQDERDHVEQGVGAQVPNMVGEGHSHAHLESSTNAG